MRMWYIPLQLVCVLPYINRVIRGNGSSFLGGLAVLLSSGYGYASSPAVCQQIDTVLSRTQIHLTPEAYKERIGMVDKYVVSTPNLTNILYLPGWRFVFDHTYYTPINPIVLSFSPSILEEELCGAPG
jgi:hypothetical protein